MSCTGKPAKQPAKQCTKKETNQTFNSMQQSHFQEADSFSASQKNTYTLWKPKIH
jgi:hypothetical protein